MSLKVGKAVIEGVTARLADLTTGFNVNVFALAQDWQTDSFEIDFLNPNSTSFIVGQVAQQALFSAMNVTLPLMTLDCVRTANQNLVKFAAFAGIGFAQIDVHIDWQGTQINDFDTFSSLVESALYLTLNQQEADFQWQAYGLLYNGDIAVSKSPIVPGARNWARTITAGMSFKIINP